MKELFEIEWFGGSAEKRFRKLRPETAELPWGTLDPKRYPPALVDAARVVWTQVALNEYRAATAFATLLKTMLEARVPLDIVGMASEFVADEVSHAEMASRVVMELGGAVPIEVDTTDLLVRNEPGLTAIQTAHEQVLRVAVISETISSAIATGTMRVARHPLLRAVEGIIARDEAHHMRLGTIYFEWAKEILDDAERERLGLVALDTLESMSVLWKKRSAGAPAAETFRLEDVQALWIDTTTFHARVSKAIKNDLMPTLRDIGLVLPTERASTILDVPTG